MHNKQNRPALDGHLNNFLLNSGRLKSGDNVGEEIAGAGEAAKTGEDYSSLRFGRLFILLAALAALAGCKGDENSDKSTIAQGSANSGQPQVSAGAAPGDGDCGDPELCRLLTPAKKLDIPRVDIPKYLAKHLSGLAEVTAPENYDPNKRNLFLIANHHYVEGDVISLENFEMLQGIQRDIIAIFHRLFEAGVSVQFLEGISPDLDDVRHDTDYPRLSESPKTAFPEYKRTGSIFRASMAVEGTYGDSVRSVGVDEMRGSAKLKRESYEALGENLDIACNKILRNIAVSLGIPVDEYRLKNSGDYQDEVRNAIWKKVSADKSGLQEKLLNEFVLGSPEFMELLNKMVGFYYWRSGGRNERMAKAALDNLSTNPADGAFIIGGSHIKYLSKLFPGMNVFVITPLLFKKSWEKHEQYIVGANFSREDWLQHFLKLFMYGFGLTDQQAKKII